MFEFLYVFVSRALKVLLVVWVILDLLERRCRIRNFIFKFDGF